MHPAIPHLVELQRVDHEIAALRAELESFPKRLRGADAKLSSARAEIAAGKEAQAGKIKKQLETAVAEHEKIIAPVPEELRELYSRIAKRHNGTALAQVRDDQCRGCGMRVLPHILQQLRTETNEEVYRCESCGLILYTLEPIPFANSPNGSANAASSASTNS